MTKTQLLKDAGITIRRNAKTGMYKVTHYKFSGPEKCNTTVGTFYNRADAIEAAREAGVGYRSFDQAEWESAK